MMKISHSKGSPVFKVKHFLFCFFLDYSFDFSLEFPHSKVTPNKKIIDLDGIEREIDVYVEKVENETTKAFAIECKNFGTKSFVKMEHIESFFGKLHRLPKEIIGVYLTTGEYQKNAIKKARKFKIQTYKINLTKTPYPNLKKSISKKRVMNSL